MQKIQAWFDVVVKKRYAEFDSKIDLKVKTCTEIS